MKNEKKNPPRNTATLLLRWYARHGRDLPWRKTRDPYKILVSEIMLQQTQVDRVILFYDRWLKRFPNWKKLANASNAQTIHTWAGLGYNRRSLILRDIAKHIIQHGIPKTETEWKTLKGIGDYTAAAVSLFTLAQRTFPIDTNIRRVLGRLLLGHPYPQPIHDEPIRQQADPWLKKQQRSADIPQALFDLATDICKKVPTCVRCPLRHQCKAAKKFLLGRVKIPKQMIKKNPERRYRNKPHPDRIYRGRILKLVREKKRVRLDEFGSLIDDSFVKKMDSPWVKSMILRLQHEGFLRIKKRVVSLSTASRNNSPPVPEQI